MKDLSVQSTTAQADTSRDHPVTEVAAPKKMNPALKAKWVKALRSGKYEQAENMLFDRGRFCCLGVLCEVAGLRIRSDGNGVIGTQFSYDPIFELVGGSEKSHALSMRNDGVKFPKHNFTQIADYIEQNL